jgi:hypothetical protein
MDDAREESERRYTRGRENTGFGMKVYIRTDAWKFAYTLTEQCVYYSIHMYTIVPDCITPTYPQHICAFQNASAQEMHIYIYE